MGLKTWKKEPRRFSGGVLMGNSRGVIGGGSDNVRCLRDIIGWDAVVWVLLLEAVLDVVWFGVVFGGPWNSAISWSSA